MSYDLEVVATRKIKYEDPKTKQWLDDIQRYTLDTSDFNYEDNVSIVNAQTPYNLYRSLVYKYWGSNEDLASHRLASDMIDYIDQQIKQATDKGYTIEWLGS